MPYKYLNANNDNSKSNSNNDSNYDNIFSAIYYDYSESSYIKKLK